MNKKATNELSPKVKAAMDTVIKQFESGDLTPITKIALLHLPDGIPAAHWSFGNVAMAYMTTNSNTDCRGFKQWKEVGRTVKKGERAGFIWRPRTMKKEDKETGEDKVVVLGFQPIPIFGYNQTEGDDLPADQIPTPREMPPLAEVAERMNVPVKFDWYNERGAGGTYAYLPDADGQIVSDSITLFSRDERVFWHELAHAVHAHIDPGFEDASSTEKETVAEFTAAVIAQMYGRADSGTSHDYIKNVAGDPIKAIMQHLATIEKVLQVITE